MAHPANHFCVRLERKAEWREPYIQILPPDTAAADNPGYVTDYFKNAARSSILAFRCGMGGIILVGRLALYPLG